MKTDKLPEKEREVKRSPNSAPSQETLATGAGVIVGTLAGAATVDAVVATIVGPPEDITQKAMEVLSYASETADDGTVRDVAVLSVNGTTTMIIDENGDGVADVIAADLDGDGVIKDTDHMRLTQHIEMQQYESLYISQHAQEMQAYEQPDYTNDANVDDFLA
ncbi:MAG: hypothetical protein LIO90_07445 [Bacteroidales bacterium]|nr:hypothetical protein [Bacteroidales bacterium]